MFSSLRSRLLLSYAQLIGVALCVVGSGLLVSFVRNPPQFRQTAVRLRLIGEVLALRLESISTNNRDRLFKLAEREAMARSVRVIILQDDGTPVYDSGENRYPAIKRLNIKADQNGDLLLAQSTYDSTGDRWLYTTHDLEGTNILVVASPAPRVKIAAYLRDDLAQPIFIAGLVALFLAVLVGWGMARWISSPLQNMARTALKISKGQYPVMPVAGPDEVKQLGISFNNMIDQVKESQDSQREFIANVSHELKTPLTSIQGFSQAILDGTAQDAQSLQQAASVIYNEANRMHRLVLDLLSLARLEAGTADLHCERIDLKMVLTHVLEKFSLQAEQKMVVLDINILSVPLMMGDGDRLAQTFTNLLDNAIKFTPPGGNVSVSASHSAGWAVIRVTDTGPGIHQEDQKRIFERFFQAEKSRKSGSARGVGLGLPIARQIVLAHGGHIEVESTPGKGTTFVVKLPLTRPDDPTLNQPRPGVN
jgi:two-component system OmpR family sensor kinase